MAKSKKAIDRIDFVMMDQDLDVFKLANKLLKGTPLMMNFEEFNVIEANKVITFLSGVTYAINGEIEMIQDKIFLFATKQDYKDGSLRKFVNEYKE
ncbi:Cell division protein SepF [Candidatus Izimaplasma bacterium HR1]|jgi:cell division inhibitor SepF|uniref:cell division protein SepF n=1 Tax=Candidatus Izimoplasma sp. HR1 TaxID=1541959 RepID=UPI0004F601CF|nr:Cell division protein SepF [Candidatus Izimaplasma bacterium HR1]